MTRKVPPVLILIFTIMLLIFTAEAVLLTVFVFQDSPTAQDTIAINELMHFLQDDRNFPENQNISPDLDYVVLDADGTVLFRTREGLSESINQAVGHRDTILDLDIGDSAPGKVILYNNTADLLQAGKLKTALLFLFLLILQWGICAGLIFYLNRRLIRPFHKLEAFARRIAEGNLDIPLEMDRHNFFGAFTESFDLMRTELKRAQIAEAKANASKKELVAKLSHDIRTPVASIKAAAEVGAALIETAAASQASDSSCNDDFICPNLNFRNQPSHSQTGKQGFPNQDGTCETYSCHGCRANVLQSTIQNNYTQIIRKADQINALVTELFTSALEELQQLPVTNRELESRELTQLLENADYLHRAAIPPVPDCLLYGDRLRLQQVFDNLFANSYKYAGTEIEINIFRTDCFLSVVIEDCGGGVNPDELPFLKEKFRRGERAENLEGAGLGLYISDYFMKEMQGKLTVENGWKGLKVTVEIHVSA